MRKVISFMHVSLDGFTATPTRELRWVKLDNDMFDFVGTMTSQSDTALYGRVTYELMEAYWPTAGSEPDASKHDKEHSAWYNNVFKVVLSRTLKNELKNTEVVSGNLTENINRLKNQEGKTIIIFGSPGASHSLVAENLVDEFWLFINPVLLGKGIPLFKDVNKITQLKLVESKTFACGVIGLHYERV